MFGFKILGKQVHRLLFSLGMSFPGVMTFLFW